MPRTPPLLLAALLALSGCGGSAAPCAGVEVGGMCWVAGPGVTLTQDRADRIYAIARRYWGQSRDPGPWTVEFTVTPVTLLEDVPGTGKIARHVDGVENFGWASPAARRIVVLPFGSEDCIERSVIFHELGHAWGVREGDPRLYGEYALMREAMESSDWPTCLGGPPDGDGDGDDR